MDYKVISNFLPKEIFNSFTNFFLEERLMSYSYVDYMSDKTDSSGFFFTNELLPNLESKNPPNFSPYFFFLSSPLFYHARIINPLRFKINCFIKQPQHIFSSPHIDRETPHKVLLYSVNTNNGFTVLDPKGQKIKIPSIANQALFFDGTIEHQAATQTDEKVRINININYLP